MICKISLLSILLSFSFSVFGACKNDAYNSSADAQTACTADNSGTPCSSGNSVHRDACAGAGNNAGTYFNSCNTSPYTDTFYYCYTGNSCPSGQTLNTSGQCVSPPCTAGQTAPVMAMTGRQISGELDMYIGGNDNGDRTTCSGGCVYSYNSNTGKTGKFGQSADGSAYFDEYSGTTTGATCTSSDPTASGSPTNSPAPGCIGDATGKIVCANSDPCGTIQGTANSIPTTICPSASDQPECVKVEGFVDPVCSGAPKNCGWVNGQYICAEPDSGPARNPDNNKICFINGVYTNCVTGVEGVETTKTTDTVIDGDTTTKTTTVDNNVIGNNPSTTTTTTNSATGISTETGKGTDDGKGDSAALNQIAKNTGETKGVLDKIFDAMSPGSATSEIGEEQTGIDAINQADLDNLTTRSTDESSFLSLDLFDVPSTSTCDSIHETKIGLTFDFDPCEKLQPMREMLGWFFYVLLVHFAYSMATRGNAR